MSSDLSADRPASRLVSHFVFSMFLTELNADFNPSDHPRASTIFLSKSQNHGELLTWPHWPVSRSSGNWSLCFRGRKFSIYFSPYFNGFHPNHSNFTQSRLSVNSPILTNVWSLVFCDVTKGTDSYPRAVTTPPRGHFMFLSYQIPEAFNSPQLSHDLIIMISIFCNKTGITLMQHRPYVVCLMNFK